MIRVLFFGTPEFASRILKRLFDCPNVEIACIVTKADKAAGRGQKLTASPVAQLAESRGVPCLKPTSVKKTLDEFISSAKSFGPFDVGIVVAYGQILPLEVLNLPKNGCVNIHASLLPRWRGAAPINRAIMAGDKESGICLMKMEEGLDTGPVYAEKRVTIAQEMTAGELHDLLAEVGSSLLEEQIENINDNPLKATPQSSDGVTYAEKITPQDAKVNWGHSAEEVARNINGLSPFPGAFTSIDGQRLKLYRARALPGQSVEPPGTITTAARDLCRIACGTGEIAILELQLEGKKRLHISEFLKGTQILHPGTILGA